MFFQQILPPLGNCFLPYYHSHIIFSFLRCAMVQWLEICIPTPGVLSSKAVNDSKVDSDFILPRSIIWVPGIPRGLVVKSKLFPRSSSPVLRQLNPIHRKGVLRFLRHLDFCDFNESTKSKIWDIVIGITEH